MGHDNGYTDSAEYFMYVTIAIVYVTLLMMVIDRVMGFDVMDKRIDNEEDFIRKDVLRKELDDKKFMYQVAAGAISLLGGSYVVATSNNYDTFGLGVGLGGLFTVIYTTIGNWDRFGSNTKIGVLGATLLALGYGSSKMYGNCYSTGTGYTNEYFSLRY
jgi:hypothetical protein